jgi:hypothetical protein
MARLGHTFGDYRRQGSMCRASSASSAGAKMSGLGQTRRVGMLATLAACPLHLQ